MMNDISCELIKDLLPLYADGICSQESKKAVEEHIKNCSDCSDELEKITDKVSMITPVPIDGEELRRAGKKLRKTKKRAVVKGVVIGLVAVVIICALLIPDIMIMLAKREYCNTAPKIEMNIKNQMDGKETVGNIKINLPDGYLIEKNESKELSTYIVTLPETGEKGEQKRINFIFSNGEPVDFYAEATSSKFINWLEDKGIKRLGFNKVGGADEYMYYLFSADEPRYSLFSGLGEKAEVFAYYYGYNLRVPDVDWIFNYENEQYKSFGCVRSRIDENGIIRSIYSFNICGRGLVIDFIGSFEKAEVESIISSIVLE